jgi:hypothetical protein
MRTFFAGGKVPCLSDIIVVELLGLLFGVTLYDIGERPHSQLSVILLPCNALEAVDLGPHRLEVAGLLKGGEADVAILRGKMHAFRRLTGAHHRRSWLLHRPRFQQGILGPTEFPFEVDRLVTLPEELDDLQPFRRNLITGVMIQHRGAVVGRPSEAAIAAKRDNGLQSHLVRKFGYFHHRCPVATKNAFPTRYCTASLDIRAERAEFQFAITENRIASRVFLQPGIFT